MEKQLFFYSKEEQLATTKDGGKKEVMVPTGITVAGLYNDKTGDIVVGKAVCGRRDKFSYKIGRAIAMGRAKTEKLGKSYLVEDPNKLTETFLGIAKGICNG